MMPHEADDTVLAAALVEPSPADRATIATHLKSIAARVASEPLNGHLSDLFRADRSGEAGAHAVTDESGDDHTHP